MGQRTDRADEMRRVLKRWSASGQSLRSFAEARGVPYSTLTYWQRRLRGSAVPAKDHRREDATTALTLTPVQFLPAASSDPIEIQLANGVQLRVPPGFSATELQQIAQVLSQC